MNKVSGGDGIPVELFQILKDDAVTLTASCTTKLREKGIGMGKLRDKVGLKIHPREMLEYH